MSAATTAITLRFIGQGASATATSTDAIVLTVTAGQEEAVMEAISFKLAEAGGMTVIADDQNSVYFHPGITALNSISVDTGAGTFKNILNGVMDGSNAELGGTAHSLVFKNAHSGSTVVLAATTATSTMTLPTAPVDGFNLKFVAAADNSAHTNTIAGSFFGILQAGAVGNSLTGTSSAVVVASKLKLGDEFTITYSGIGSKYYLTGILKTAAGITAS